MPRTVHTHGRKTQITADAMRRHALLYANAETIGWISQWLQQEPNFEDEIGQAEDLFPVGNEQIHGSG